MPESAEQFWFGRTGGLSCLCRPAPSRALPGTGSLSATFTRHELRVGGRAEYFLTLPEGKRWSGSWKFTAVNPVSSFEACDGEDNVTQFSSIEAMEQSAAGIEEGPRAAMPQLDAELAERNASAAHVQD